MFSFVFFPRLFSKENERIDARIKGDFLSTIQHLLQIYTADILYLRINIIEITE